MLAALLILIFAFFIVFFTPRYREEPEEDIDELQKTPQIKKLWNLAQTAMKERKPLKAEKALLTILKFDEKNAGAYNRLGILYAKQKNYKEAVDCFEIAQSLDNNASSLHNVGLIYLETGKYEKAALAFEKAIQIEGDQPGRYIAYAKALEKIGERGKAIEALEAAYSLNPSTVVLRHMLEIYENSNDTENAERVRTRINELQAAKLAAEEKAKLNRRSARQANKAQVRAARAEAKAARAAARPQHQTVCTVARRATTATVQGTKRATQVATKPVRKIISSARSSKKQISIKGDDNLPKKP